MTIIEYLKERSEPTPKWISDFKIGDKINPSDFFSSRVMYYPGCGDDGSVLKVFNKGHYCHCYIYADFAYDEAQVRERLDTFAGYNLLSTISLTEDELIPSWIPHYTPSFEEASRHVPEHKPFGLFCVYEREQYLDDDHGCDRFVLLYLNAEGEAAYDAIFANGYCKDFSLFVQDYNFGGVSSFGNNGIMHSIAKKTGAFPQYIYGVECDVWSGYRKVDAEPTLGGNSAINYYIPVQDRFRWLYERDTSRKKCI